MDSKLADITSVQHYVYLKGAIAEKAEDVSEFYINSIFGNDYGRNCITFKQGGKVMVPRSGCDGKLPFVCQLDLKHVDI